MSKDFSGQDLRGRSFEGQDLEGADFSNADIRGANFQGANLREANLTKANIRSTNFTKAILVDVNLEKAEGGLHFQKAILLSLGLLLLISISGVAFANTGNLASTGLIPKNIKDYTLIPALAIYIVLVCYFTLIILKGFTSFILYLLTGVAVTLAVLEIGVGLLLGEKAEKIISIAAWNVAGTGAWVVVGTLLEAVALVAVIALTGVTVGRFAILIVTSIILVTCLQVAGVLGGAIFGVWAMIVAGTFAMLGYYSCWRALSKSNDEKFSIIRTAGVGLASYGGTSFRDATLHNCNFSQTLLKNTDLSKATLTRTNFYRTKKIDFARVGNTILANPNVLNLLVTGNGRGKSYAGANLRGANLQYADLEEANLKDADITGATFEGANLEWGNLTRTQAIDTDFTNAYMTGACVEAWNIESTTILDNINCRFVYLLENPKPGTDDRERRPNSKEFGKGEFTKLFQEVLSTIDIIFRDGIDWKAFIQSFRQVQVENQGTELSVNSIENKGDGVFVIKVNTPPKADKEKIHSELVQRYEEQLKALESRYNLELEVKDKDIEKYRQRYTDIQEITKLLAEKQIPLISQPVVEKVVLLKFNSLDETTDIIATAQIWANNHPQPISFEGKLPAATKIIELYNRIHTLCNPDKNNNRAGFAKGQVANISIQEILNLSEDLKTDINNWFNSPSFLNVANQLRTKLNPSDSIRFIIQTSEIKLKLLPLHLWDFFGDYRKAEIALSAPQGDRLSKTAPKRKKVRVLVILGNSKGIEEGVQADLEALNKLPEAEITVLPQLSKQEAEITVLPQLSKQELDEHLWHPLGWDIICYSGHSDGEDDGSTGYIEIDGTIKISPKHLKSALTNAIENGLQLAIFNSCKGLGIAQDLAELHIPQIIVMRQLVPDEVATVFLENFLQAFINDKSLYNSVREARQKLEGLENRYPCASWLPVICQNPAEVPLKWLQFPGAGKPQIDNLLTQLHRLIEEDYTITPVAQAEALEQVKLIAEALQNQDELVDKKQVKTNITLLRGILAGQPAASSLLVELNEVLAEIYRLCDLN